MSCPHQQLVDLLDGALSDSEQASLEAHLERCDSCRSKLEVQAAPAEFWQDTARRLTKTDGQSLTTQFATGAATAVPPQVLMETLRQWTEQPGEALGSIGKYELDEVLGYGGMGLVVRGVDREIQREVAIKTLLQPLQATSVACDRLIREATAVASLDHRNVITIYSVDSWRDVPYIVMPFVAGGTLARMAEHRRLTVAESLGVATQVADALSCAHDAGIVHRDIKPSNILLQDGCEHVLLADFGLARVAGDHSLTETGAIPGTPQFMSPEQARGKAIDQRSDQFSLGSLLFWMLTGQSLFAAESQHAILLKLTEENPLANHPATKEIPSHLRNLLRKLLQQDADQRYGNVAEVKLLIERCLDYESERNLSAIPVELRDTSGKQLWKTLIRVASLALLLLAAWMGIWSLVTTGTSQTDVGQEQSQPAEQSASVEKPQPQDDQLQYGPLDELEIAKAKDQLENGEQEAYWLRRLAYLDVEQIPSELLPAVELIAETHSGALRELALVILRKDPFIEVEEAESSPFEMIESES